MAFFKNLIGGSEYSGFSLSQLSSPHPYCILRIGQPVASLHLSLHPRNSWSLSHFGSGRTTHSITIFSGCLPRWLSIEWLWGAWMLAMIRWSWFKVWACCQWLSSCLSRIRVSNAQCHCLFERPIRAFNTIAGDENRVIPIEKGRDCRTNATICWLLPGCSLGNWTSSREPTICPRILSAKPVYCSVSRKP